MRTTLPQRLAWPIGAAFALLLPACGGGSGPTAADGQPASVTVTALSNIVGLAETTTLASVVLDSSGTPVADQPIVWTIDNAAVASVSAAGVVTPLAQGTATVRGVSGALSGKTTIEVVYAVADVDFSKPQTVGLEQGLLHGLNVDNLPTPPAETIGLIAPRYWRATPYGVSPTFADSFGASYDIVLSDLWGYPSTGWPNGKPWLATSAYASMMTSTIASLTGAVKYWEIWNEPDQASGSSFWDGSEAQFFATYLAAYRILRQQLGAGAIVVGPSLTRYDEGFLDRFAAFCIANGCQANALSWHENGTSVPTQGIVSTVAAARARFGPGSANAALGVRMIHINEYTAPAQAHMPVASLLYLQYFEQAGVDAAARACWSDSLHLSECFDNSLDGLITPLGFKPRSVGYGYQLYAQGVSGRVQSKSSLAQMLSLGSSMNGRAGTVPDTVLAQVLVGIGDAEQVAALPTTLRLGIRLTGLSAVPALAGKPSASIRLFAVAPSGESASVGPTLVNQRVLSVDAGKAGVVVEAAQAETVYQVVLTP